MNISKENRLLLYCAQPRISEDTLNKVKDIMNYSLNWEEVLESALWQGIAPLLYTNLKKIQGSHFVPKKVMDKLEKTYYGNVARNMYLYEELKRILEEFREKGVEAIVLKGAALVKTVYSDIGLRQMSDIDLLVKKEDLTYVERIMTGLGYFFPFNEPAEYYREDNHHMRYINKEKNIKIEIHWHIACNTHPLRIRIMDADIIEGWWERAKTLDFFDIKTLVLCPEDLIIHLCLHFLKHRFKNQKVGFSSEVALIQLCDIFQTLKHYRDEINWVGLKCKAEKYGIHSHIYITLSIVNEFIVKHDDTFHNALSGFASGSLDKEIIRLINKKILIKEDGLPVITAPFIRSLAAKTFREKLKTVLREIFPDPEVVSKTYSVPLSSKRLYLYYLNRPLSMLLKYGKAVLEVPRIKEDLILKKWTSSKD